MTRRDMLDSLSAASVSGQPFWGAAVSTGEEAARAGRLGASWVTATHGCMFDDRVPASVMGLLPYTSANAETLSLSELARTAPLPVLAGVFASDQFTRLDHLLKEMWNAGFRGVQNFPSVGLAEGRFAGFVRESGMDYAREVAMAEKAREMDFFISAVVFSPEQAEAMALAGADMIVFHPGLNADGEFRGRTQATLERFAEVAAAAKSETENVLLARLAFEPEDFAVGEPRYGIQYDRSI